MAQKKGFFFSRSWAEVLLALPSEVRHEVNDALLIYFTEGKYPKLSQLAEVAMVSIRNDIRKIEDARAEASERNRKNVNVRWNRQKSMRLDTNDTKNTTRYEDIRMDTKETKKEKRAKEKRTKEPFIKPSIEEIKAYLRERGSSKYVDAGLFYDYYESKGWMVGRNLMKNWKAAIRNWERRYKDKNKGSGYEIDPHKYDNIETW